MKIDEFIEKVNDHDGMIARKTAEGIVIDTPNNMGIFNIPEDATNYIEIDTWATSNSLYWKKADREYLSALIEELLHTPIKERFPEKKWRLLIGNNDYGGDLYLMHIDGAEKPLRTALAANNKFTIFTDSDIAQLKEEYPRLAPAIDAMKEPVEDE